jgi:hypothetical protein
MSFARVLKRLIDKWGGEGSSNLKAKKGPYSNLKPYRRAHHLKSIIISSITHHTPHTTSKAISKLFCVSVLKMGGGGLIILTETQTQRFNQV